MKLMNVAHLNIYHRNSDSVTIGLQGFTVRNEFQNWKEFINHKAVVNNCEFCQDSEVLISHLQPQNDRNTPILVWSDSCQSTARQEKWSTFLGWEKDTCYIIFKVKIDCMYDFPLRFWEDFV